MNPSIVLDARDLEPPEPMVRTMEALDKLARSEKLLVLLPREPYPLVQGARTQRFHLEDQAPSRRHGGSPDPTSSALMQALLSFDQAPPLAAPLRFFLTAPLFAILAALLLLWSGPDLFASRWTGAALALTHLITVGFMLQVMLGAMLQILPVVAGANISRPQLLATLVNAAVATGALLLASGFLSYQPLLSNWPPC
jgi:hypothetical protein